MKNPGFWFLIVMIAAVGIVFGFVIERPYTFRGSVIDPAVPAPKFTLLSSQGGEYRLDSKTGKFVLIFFGYTYCPDVCPTTLYEMKEIKTRLKDKAENIEFVFITVDPERDTQDQLERYLSSFDESFYGLTGTTQQLESVWKDYGVYRGIQETDNSLGYLVDHTSRLYLINSKSELMMTYTYETTLDEIVSDLNYLIKKADL
ncbi:MAG: SCO family protein [Anaerolineaceae bacterium]|nr:SCO family protein [Anaerolineaceae bacterium]